MSLEAILTAIEVAGAAEVAQLRAAAAAQVERILAAAEQAAQQQRAVARRTAMQPSPGECARILHQGKLEAGRTLGQARHQVTEAILAAVRHRLAAARHEPHYAATLRRLAEEALGQLYPPGENDGPVVVETDSRDTALLEGLLPSELVIKPTLETWGGVVVHNTDDTLIVDNTLESRLERALPYIRALIAKEVDA